MGTLIDNATWGVKWGAAMATVFSLVALAIYAIAGDRALHTPGLTIGAVLLSYWSGGLAAGLLLGLARPLLRYRLGLGVVGALAGIVVCAAIQLARKGAFWMWTPGDVITTVLVGGIMGCLAAFDPR